jgi:hypothetical protein
MEPLSLDDKQTLQAIGILADTLDEVSGRGVFDTILVSKALRQVLATQSRPAFDFASRAFSTLDPELRRQVADDADVRARQFAGAKAAERRRARRRLGSSEKAVKDTELTAHPAPASASGLLAALNARGRGRRSHPG